MPEDAFECDRMKAIGSEPEGGGGGGVQRPRLSASIARRREAQARRMDYSSSANNSHKLKFHITHIAPNCSMITHSAKQNHPCFWVLADLDGRLLLCLGKMGRK